MASAPAKGTFGETLLKITNYGSMAMSISLGLKLGLFKEMAKYDAYKTVQDIADAMNLKERYVQEWLKVMVTSEIVEVTGDGLSYFLPMAFRDHITCKDLDTAHVLYFLKFLATYGKMEQNLMSAFQKDGPRGITFEEMPVEEGEYAGSMEQHTLEHLRSYINNAPGITERLEKGGTIMEIGCNGAEVTFTLAQHYTNAKCYGVDIDEIALTTARSRLATLGISERVQLFNQDVTALPDDWSDKFDYVISTKVIHDVPHIRKALKEIKRCMKKGGCFSILEYNISSNPAENIGHWLGPTISTGSLFYCLPLSSHCEGGECLGSFCGREKLINLIEDAGFSKAELITTTINNNDDCLLGHYLAIK